MKWPEARAVVAGGLFALTALIFVIIWTTPKIAEVQLFGVLATAIISGGLGGVSGYYFGSSKGPPQGDAE